MAYKSESESEPVAPPAAAPPVAPPKKKREGTKMTEKQKSDLKRHMKKMKDGGMSLSESRSHQMKMMSRMRKGMSIKKAHSDIMK